VYFGLASKERGIARIFDKKRIFYLSKEQTYLARSCYLLVKVESKEAIVDLLYRVQIFVYTMLVEPVFV
jgi:hypothetical protein